MLRRRRNRARPHDIWIPSHAQSRKQTNADVAIAWVLHGTEQRPDRLDRDAIEIACVYGTSSSSPSLWLTKLSNTDTMYSRCFDRGWSCERRLAVHQFTACCVDLLWLGDYGACDGAAGGNADGIDFECAAVAVITIIYSLMMLTNYFVCQ